jgi:hypothetical protein
MVAIGRAPMRATIQERQSLYLEKGHGSADYSQDYLPAPATAERSTMQLMSPFETTPHEKILPILGNEL